MVDTLFNGGMVNLRRLLLSENRIGSAGVRPSDSSAPPAQHDNMQHAHAHAHAHAHVQATSAWDAVVCIALIPLD